MTRTIAALAAACCLLYPNVADAWGTSGHHLVNDAAMHALPDDLPAFLRAPQTIAAITSYGTEMDRLKGAGFSFDRDDDPAHFVDIGDDHRIGGLVSLEKLPQDMEAYEAVLQRAGTDPYRMGYLPYSIADGWEILRKDFAYWRAFDYLAMNGRTASDRAAFAAERTWREALIVHDIGVWGHFVGDGSQPLHTSVHYNDGGIHAPFEGAFVRDHVTLAAVQA